LVKFILIILFPILLFGIDYIDLQDPSFEFYYDSNEISIGPDSIGNFSGMLRNNSSVDIGIAMIRRDSNLNESWSSSICIGSICYNETIDSASTTINAGDSTSCGVLVWTNGSGNGNVQIEIFDLDFPDVTEIIDVNFFTSNLHIQKGDQFRENVNILSCYPNPFNPVTNIKFELNSSNNLNIDILDVRGAIVRKLFNGYQEKGSYQIVWDAKNNFGCSVSSGVYFFHIKSGNYIRTQKLLYFK